MLADLFTHPMILSSQTFWLIIPVSVAVAIVYKTVRIDSLKRLPLGIATLSLYILAGEAAVLLVGWLFLTVLG